MCDFVEGHNKILSQMLPKEKLMNIFKISKIGSYRYMGMYNNLPQFGPKNSKKT